MEDEAEFEFTPCPVGFPPYESGVVWTSTSDAIPGDGFEPSDILIRERLYPMTLFKWTKRALTNPTNVIDITELVGTAEIANVAGVTPQAVYNWSKRYSDFPKPVRVLRMGPVWDLKSIAIWLSQREHPEIV